MGYAIWACCPLSDLTVRLQPLFVIGSDIPVRLQPLFVIGSDIPVRLQPLFVIGSDLTVCPQPLFVIGSDIPAQLIAFLNRLFQLGTHPWDLTFVDSLDGDAFLIGYRRPPDVLTGAQLITQHGYCYQGICGREANLLWSSWVSSGMDTLHLNVLISDKQQGKVLEWFPM